MCSMNGGNQQWTIGERVTVEGELVPCVNGLHVCRDERDLLDRLGPVICECEHSDEYVDGHNERVCRWVTITGVNPHWNERAARHFACDCAEYALPFAAESERDLLSACIDISRAYADWPEEWNTAWTAAWTAAGAAGSEAAG